MSDRHGRRVLELEYLLAAATITLIILGVGLALILTGTSTGLAAGFVGGATLVFVWAGVRKMLWTLAWLRDHPEMP
jgi:putative Mn2+ efflux pump MntP